MAIVVDYTPYGAIGQMAQQAGENQAIQRQQEMNFQQDMAVMENQMRQQNMAFAANLEQQARAEEFMYQAKYLQMKREIDIQMELSEYQKNRQKLNMALDTINGSDSLTQAEKEELVIQATAKYSEVGAGISPANFAQKLDPLVRKYQESALKRGKLEEIYAGLEDGTLDEQAAQHEAETWGLGKLEFESDEAIFQKKIDAQAKRLADAQKRLTENFVMDGKKILNVHTKARVSEGTEEYALFKTLKEQVDREKSAMDSLATSMTTRNVQRGEFYRKLESSPSLQRAAKEHGEERVFNEWRRGADKNIDLFLFEEPRGTRPTNLSPTGMPMY